MPDDNPVSPAADPAAPPVITPRAVEETPPPEDKSAADQVRENLKLAPFWDRMIHKKEEPEKKDEPKEDPKDKSDEPAEKPEKAEESEAKPEDKPKKPAKKAAPTIDPLKVAEAQGREIGKAIGASLAKKDAPAEPAKSGSDESELAKRIPEEDLEVAEPEVFLEMQRMFPDKYKDLVKRLAEKPQREEEYAKKWKSDHPGEEFDPDDKEHDEFYEKQEKLYSRADLRKAEKELLRREIKKEGLSDQDRAELEDYKRDKKLRSVQPAIDSEVLQTVTGALADIDPEATKTVKSIDSLRTYSDENPIAAEIIGEIGNQILPLIQTNIRLSEGVETWNGNNRAHAALSSLIANVESTMLAAPIEDRFDDKGRMFATTAEYIAMSPAERGKHWFVGRDEINFVLRQEAKRLAKQRWETEEKKASFWAKRTGGKPPTASTTTQNGDPHKRQNTPQDTPRIPTPTMTGRATVGKDATDESGKDQSPADVFFGRLGVR